MNGTTATRVKSVILSGLLAGTVFLAGCAGGLADSKVATVDGTPITRTAYDKTYKEFQKAFYVGNVPDSQKAALTDTLKRMTLEKLIAQTLIYNEAAKAGVTVTSAEVTDYKNKKILKDPVIAQQFKAFLTQNKMQESDFDAILKDNLLANKLIEAKGGPQVAVSDAEIKTLYDKHKDQFRHPERIHASHILVKAIEPQMKQELRAKTPTISDAELGKAVARQKETLKAKADKLFSEVKANPSRFEALAKVDSEDAASAGQGGDLGFMAQESTDPAFWAAIQKTPDGRLYPGVVSTPFGFHIVKVLAHQPPYVQTFEEAKPLIRDHLAQMKRQAFMQQWIEQQKTAAKIDIEPAYKPQEAPPPAAATAPPAVPPAAKMPSSASSEPGVAKHGSRG